MKEKLLIVDMGTQYAQLVCKSLRGAGLYSEIDHHSNLRSDYSTVKGLILSSTPYNGNNSEREKILEKLEKLSLPILEIGTELFESVQEVERGYRRRELSIIESSLPLFNKIPSPTTVWSYNYTPTGTVPQGALPIASTSEDRAACLKIEDREHYILRFHPEIVHSTAGVAILENFAREVCHYSGEWNAHLFIQESIKELKEKIGEDKVILGLSGGVDSTVAAVLLHKAIGSRLHSIFIDTGLLRAGEFEQVLAYYKAIGLNVKGIEASSQFLQALKGVTEPEEKRKAIGRLFVEQFEAESNKIEGAKWLAQGTIYPDIIESSSPDGTKVAVKSHHNVGGLPSHMRLKVVEPLKLLFKDEVRKVGAVLNIEATILNRHPFPGPGLGIRVLGEVTYNRLETLRAADKIFIDHLREANLYDSVWQAGAILLPIKSVGVSAGERTYKESIALRAVSSVDGMTAECVELPYPLLFTVAEEIMESVAGVNRVVYDISSKPPATIEWE
ncbi:MAG: glutamine-hydrolyzing GMP synthase [Bacteroidales bacterium]